MEMEKERYLAAVVLNLSQAERASQTYQANESAQKSLPSSRRSVSISDCEIKISEHKQTPSHPPESRAANQDSVKGNTWSRIF